MNHRPSAGQTRTVEALALYRLPSKQDSTLSSQLNDRLAIQSYNDADNGFCIELCRTLISLWQQCVDEQFVSVSDMSPSVDLLTSTVHPPLPIG